MAKKLEELVLQLVNTEALMSKHLLVLGSIQSQRMEGHEDATQFTSSLTMGLSVPYVVRVLYSLIETHKYLMENLPPDLLAKVEAQVPAAVKSLEDGIVSLYESDEDESDGEPVECPGCGKVHAKPTRAEILETTPWPICPQEDRHPMEAILDMLVGAELPGVKMVKLPADDETLGVLESLAARHKH